MHYLCGSHKSQQATALCVFRQELQGTEPRGDCGSGQKTEFHQPPGVVAGKVDRIQDSDVSAAEGEAWADLGAGDGVFTRALAALVGPAGQVFAVDEDDRALSAVRAWASAAGSGPSVTVLRADVTKPLGLPPRASGAHPR